MIINKPKNKILEIEKELSSSLENLRASNYSKAISSEDAPKNKGTVKKHGKNKLVKKFGKIISKPTHQAQHLLGMFHKKKHHAQGSCSCFVLFGVDN